MPEAGGGGDFKMQDRRANKCEHAVDRALCALLVFLHFEALPRGAV